jgi:hypothetical protein
MGVGTRLRSCSVGSIAATTRDRPMTHGAVLDVKQLVDG